MKALLLLAALPAAAACAPAVVTAPQSLSAGERAYQKCYACHAIEPGRNDLAGPSLHGIVGRPIAAERGFEYSPALRSFAQRHPAWTPELIDRFAADPEALVPGTTMAFHGMADAAERAALLDYLGSLGT